MKINLNLGSSKTENLKSYQREMEENLKNIKKIVTEKKRQLDWQQFSH